MTIEITTVDVPGEAAEGETVSVSASAVHDDPIASIDVELQVIRSDTGEVLDQDQFGQGGSGSVSGSFEMPNQSVEVTALLVSTMGQQYDSDSEWISYDSDSGSGTDSSETEETLDDIADDPLTSGSGSPIVDSDPVQDDDGSSSSGSDQDTGTDGGVFDELGDAAGTVYGDVSSGAGLLLETYTDAVDEAVEYGGETTENVSEGLGGLLGGTGEGFAGLGNSAGYIAGGVAVVAVVGGVVYLVSQT